jgi:membrane-bound lytic murein transglycosylase A
VTRRVRYVIGITIALVLVAWLLAYLFYRKQQPRLTLAPATFDQLAGWRDDRVAAALPALLRSCAAIVAKPDGPTPDPLTKSVDFGTIADWRGPCAAAAAVPAGNDAAARQFFESGFLPFLAGNNGDNDGLFTGYFEITFDGSHQRGGPYQTPLYRRPPEELRTRFSRAEIENGALAGQGLELLWASDPIDAFFLEIQGSGLVRLPGGGTVRVGYDGSNGHSYVPVGRLLIESGEMPREKVTMAGIRAWMKAHPKEGAELRRENASYVFFREIAGPGPLGAERVVLSAGRSLAVDRRFIPLGVPIWLDAVERFQPVTLRRLVVAQDSGGAIKGPVRGDLFWGNGKAAADGAGAMNAKGRYYLLLPKAVAARIDAVAPAH